MASFSVLELVNNTITTAFAIWTLGVLFRAMATVKRGARGKIVEIAPTMMTSIGILGTFVGIVLGLFAFDPAHVDESIRGLLGGLRTAFLTSVVGMGCTMYFKWWDARQVQPHNPDAAPETIGPQDIFGALGRQEAQLERLVQAVGGSEETSLIGQVKLMRTDFVDFRTSYQRAQQALEEQFGRLVQAIGGSEENSLVGQVKLMRTDVIDFRTSHQRAQQAFEQKLWTQLETFSEMLSRSATQQVIEALKQVIVEFNTNLTEQFGDNFKRLDESVRKLVEWQAEYRQQLERMITLYDQGVQSIDATRVAVVDIQDKTGRIPTDMQALSSVLEVNQHQIQELTRHLEAFMAMRQEAIQAVPQIQRMLEDVGTDLKDGADRMNRIILEGATEFGQSVVNVNGQMLAMAGEVAHKTEGISQELTDALTKVEQNTDRIRNGISEAVQTAMEAVQSSVDETSKLTTTRVSDAARTMSDAVKQASQAMIGEARHSADETQKAVEATLSTLRQTVERGLVGIEKQIAEAVGRTGEAVNVQLRAVDEALEKQLNMALSQLGSALATIATHLVDTYKRQARDVAGAL